MTTKRESDRRMFLQRSAVAGAMGVIGGTLALRADPEKPKTKAPAGKEEVEVQPNEDLMREHGLLKRVLLIYGEAVRRLDSSQDVPPETLADSAKIIRSFIEDYHEKLEQDFLFPRFRKANKLVELVDVLEAQHQAGRRVTDVTLRLSTSQAIHDPGDRKRLAESLRSFVRMYSPHEAREDTVLFPAFRTIVSEHEYAALGEQFEDKEHQLFGEDGFEKMVDRVAGIEKALGIYDLAQFTPPA